LQALDGCYVTSEGFEKSAKEAKAMAHEKLRNDLYGLMPSAKLSYYDTVLNEKLKLLHIQKLIRVNAEQVSGTIKLLRISEEMV